MQLSAAAVHMGSLELHVCFRYYWESDDVMVRMINAAIGYGYEYLGNSSRLVITPLTDRYLSLSSTTTLDLIGS